MESRSLQFATAARVLADTARRAGLRPPAFRSPPRRTGAERTVRRSTESGEVTVAVRVRGRSWPGVLADLVEGVVVANDLDGADAARWRDAGWRALEAAGSVNGSSAEPARLHPAPEPPVPVAVGPVGHRSVPRQEVDAA